jgi:hypothetical protein
MEELLEQETDQTCLPGQRLALTDKELDRHELHTAALDRRALANLSRGCPRQ